MNAQESYRYPEAYSKTKVDLILQVLAQQIDAKLEKVLAETASTKLFLYAAVLPMLLAVLAILISLSFRIH